MLPIPVEAFELECKRVGTRDREIEGGKFEADHVTVMQARHHEPPGDRYGLTRLEYFRQHHRGRGGIERNVCRIEGVVALGAAEKQPAGAVRIVSAEVEFLRLQTVTAVETAYFGGARIKAHQPVVGAQPEAACCIGMNAVHCVIGQAVARVENVEADRFRHRCAANDPIETIASADPDSAMWINMDRIHRRATEGARLMSVVEKVKKSTRGGIQDVQAATIGSHPQLAGAVLRQCRNAAGGQTPGVGGFGYIALETAGSAIEPRQSATVGPNPYAMRGVLQQGHDSLGPQTMGIVRIMAVDGYGECAGHDAIEATLHGAGPHDALMIRQQRHYTVVAQPRRTPLCAM